MKLVLLAALFVACLGALSWFRGYRISMGCVGNLCADAGFAESVSGILLGILAVVLLTVKLLVRLKNHSAP